MGCIKEGAARSKRFVLCRTWKGQLDVTLEFFVSTCGKQSHRVTSTQRLFYLKDVFFVRIVYSLRLQGGELPWNS